MKKIHIATIFSVSSLIIANILSNTFDFSLSNTWQAGVVLLFVFGPFWVYGWYYSNLCKHTQRIISLFIRFSLILLLAGYVITTLAFLFVGW